MGKEFIESDKQVLTFDLPEAAKLFYDRQTAESKGYIDAFVKGINDYARMHPEAIDVNKKQVLPAVTSDVFATISRFLFRFLTANEREATEKLFQPGSNAYAIGPSRSASGNAMLVINPHIEWDKDFAILFEAHLNSNEFNTYGSTFLGIPILRWAFNENLGWTHTTNTLDASDRYELILQNGGYLLDGEIQQFKKKTIVMKIKQQDGKLKADSLQIRISRHGPVLGEKDNKAWAVRVSGLNNYKLFEQYHKMQKAKSWKEFESAIKMMQIPYSNLVYADKAGNIFYLFNGNIPKRPHGDFAFWRGTIDGTKSNLIWQETLGYDDLPKVLNPPSGFLQNANDPPWSCTYPAVLDPSKYLPYIAPQTMGLRPQRAVNMIKNDTSISFDEMIGYKLNTGVEAAYRFLDDLFNAVKKYPDSIALKAMAVLQSWDKLTDAKSKGAVLFSAWFDKLTPAIYTKRWNRMEPLSTPDGLNDERQAVELLVKAANEVEKKYGSMDIAWGEVYRIRMDDVDLPANGGTPQHGIFMSMRYALDPDNKYRAIAGETFIAVTEFGKNLKASVLLAYGNASQPGSKHRKDQLKLLSEKELRPALLTRADILKHLEKKKSGSATEQISGTNLTGDNFFTKKRATKNKPFLFAHH